MNRSDSRSSSDGERSPDHRSINQAHVDGSNNLQRHRHWNYSVMNPPSDEASTSSNPHGRGTSEGEQLPHLDPADPPQQLDFSQRFQMFERNLQEMNILGEGLQEMNRILLREINSNIHEDSFREALQNMSNIVESILDRNMNRLGESTLDRNMEILGERPLESLADGWQAEQFVGLEQAIQESIDQYTKPVTIEQKKRTGKLLGMGKISATDDDIYSRACSIAITTVEEIDGDMARTRMQEHIFERELERNGVDSKSDEFKQLLRLHRKKVFPHALRQATCELRLELLRNKQSRGESLLPEEECSQQMLNQEYEKIIQDGEKMVQQQQEIARRMRQEQEIAAQRQQDMPRQEKERTSQPIRRSRIRQLWSTISCYICLKNQSS